MISWIRHKLLELLWDRPRGEGACANRRWSRRTIGPIEYTVIARNTLEPDGYSREELFEMLETVRKHEAAQGWRAPDPIITECDHKLLRTGDRIWLPFKNGTYIDWCNRCGALRVNVGNDPATEGEWMLPREEYNG